MEDKMTQIENETKATEEVVETAETKTEEVAAEATEEAVEAVAEEAVVEEPVVEETMDDYKDMLDSSMMQFRPGDIVDGEVISVTDTEVLINFGYIADGIVPAAETFADASNPLSDQFSVGDKVKAEVLKKDDGDGNVLLSLKKALQEVVWEKLAEAMEAGSLVEALVTEGVKGGLVCKVLGSRAFMPGSMISTSYVEDFAAYNGQTLMVKVVELDREKNRVIVSRKVVEQEENAKKKDELFATIKKGDVFTGTVKKNMHFGSFVDIGGADGLVHINELSWDRVNKPSDVVKEGDVVTVTVINVDYAKKKIGLSMKDTKNDPWNPENSTLVVGESYEGTVKRVLDFGAFVEVVPGIEGLVHVSQLSAERVNHPSDVVKEGDTVTVKILGIDAKDKKLKLTMKPDAPVEEKQEYVNLKDFQTDEKATTNLGSIFKDLDLDIK